MTQSEVHNAALAGIVKSIVMPPLESGGKAADVLVLLESVVTGVLLGLGEIEGWGEIERETFLRTVVGGVRQRMSKAEQK